ncbi:MAG: holo-ACP synthase [Deltaproteobacteria bacterium]|nr:holo-ACP synthase [Deltaproteobacteria bacterium]
MIGSIGIDLVEIERIKRIISKWNGRFLRRIFTESEIAYCESNREPSRHYAARFAAKEALFKSLGAGIGGEMRFTDVEVRNEGTGRPELELHGTVRDRMKAAGFTAVHVSLSHTDMNAVAVVALEKNPAS